ncbi:hypothetical protein Dimus_005528 [Dionaea muscipula]
MMKKGKGVVVEPANVDEAKEKARPLPAVGADKAVKEAIRHEWMWGAMTVKYQSISKNLDDVSLNQLMTQVAIQKEKSTSIPSSMKANLYRSPTRKPRNIPYERTAEAEEEKKARDEAKLCRSQLTTMEQNHVKAHNAAAEYKGKVEAAASALKKKDAKLV